MRKLTIIFLFLMVNVWFALGWTPPSPITPPDTIPDAVANMNFGITGGSVPAAAPPSIPTATAHYLFNNDATDETTNHNLTAEAGFTYDDTLKMEGSHAGNFDVDDYVSVAHHADFDIGATDDFSASVWIRSTWLGTSVSIFSKTVYDDTGVGYRLSLEDSDSYNMHLIITQSDGNLTNIDTGWTPTIEIFYHVVVAFDYDAENEVTIWVSSSGGTFGDQINGTSYNCDHYPYNTATAFRIGAEEVYSLPWYGQMDDFRWWKGTVLTATQAEALYDLY